MCRSGLVGCVPRRLSTIVAPLATKDDDKVGRACQSSQPEEDGLSFALVRSGPTIGASSVTAKSLCHVPNDKGQHRHEGKRRRKKMRKLQHLRNTSSDNTHSEDCCRYYQQQRQLPTIPEYRKCTKPTTLSQKMARMHSNLKKDEVDLYQNQADIVQLRMNIMRAMMLLRDQAAESRKVLLCPSSSCVETMSSDNFYQKEGVFPMTRTGHQVSCRNTLSSKEATCCPILKLGARTA